jgi:acyl-CoA synthetase (NDP forming)/RimJ/RimL family protein N-acetyltransferase
MSPTASQAEPSRPEADLARLDATAAAVTPGVYPTRWEADVALADGGTVHVRPVRPDDAALVEAFHARQSRESIYFRYFSPMPSLSRRELDRLTKVDYLDHLTFIAVLGDQIIGMAGYDRRSRSDEAEVAFITDDEHHGRGLATVLLEWLVVAARETGFRRLTAQVLPNNRRMLAVFHTTGFETSSTFDEGVVEVHLGLEPTAAARAAVEERGRRAEARSVVRLMSPTSIAVIGAGRDRGGLGHEVFRNLLTHDFNGPVYPVNPQGGHVASVPSYPTVLDIPQDVDLAVIAVPAHEVLGVVDQCARKRVQGLVVISAGLHGAGPLGDAAERALVERARSQGMRLIGPESLGVINTDPEVALHASIATLDVPVGRVGFLTQSGTLGIAAIEHASRVGLGFSTFVDAGAKADVSGNDMLQYWEDDERTSVVALYLESFGNPRKFTRIARRLSRRKPIIAVKAVGSVPSWRSRGGDSVSWVEPISAADRSDRERVVIPADRPTWPSDGTVAAMLSQSGVMRVDTPTELFDLARVAAVQPVPSGRRVAIVSNSRGSSNLTLDAIYGAGLAPASLSDATRGHLAAELSEGAAVTNPVDLTFAAGPAAYEVALAAVLADEGVDSVIVVYAPPSQSERVAVGEAIVRAVEAARQASTDQATTSATTRAPVAVVATFLGAEIDAPLGQDPIQIPLFEFPNGAARVLGQLTRHGEYLSEPEGELPVFDPAELDGARERLTELLATSDESRWLDTDEAAGLLAEIGLDMMPFRLVDSADEAVQAAEALGHPVVIKATGLARLSKSESGGVALDVHGADEVRAAYERMVGLLGPAMQPAMVQSMAASGLDVLVAGHQDRTYGSIVSLGLGGSVADANPRRAVRVLPLTDLDAARLILASPLANLLPSSPGAQRTPHLESLLVRLGWVVEQLPELADIELNPVLAAGDSVSITAARIRVARSTWEPEPDVRRLQ